MKREPGECLEIVWGMIIKPFPSLIYCNCAGLSAHRNQDYATEYDRIGLDDGICCFVKLWALTIYKTTELVSV